VTKLLPSTNDSAQSFIAQDLFLRQSVALLGLFFLKEKVSGEAAQ
jgi:hypothetical protein